MTNEDYEPSIEKEDIREFIDTYNLKPYTETYLSIYDQIDRKLMSSLIQSITNTFDHFGRSTL